MRAFTRRCLDMLTLLKLSLRLQLGTGLWLVPPLALLWPAYQALSLVLGWRTQRFEPDEAQNVLIGFPLVVLAIGLGVRIIAAEVEQRTLEVTYTVPGGAARALLAKLAAAMLVLVAAAALLAGLTVVVLTPVPAAAVYGALQGAVFYLVLAMGLGAWLKSEITAALVAAIALALNGFATGFGGAQSRWSPLFNPLALDETSAANVLAWTLQNRIGVALLIIALVVLSLARAERREQLLRV